MKRSTDSSRPLAGRTVVVTRPERHAGVLAALLESEGACALRYPVIDIQPCSSAALDGVLSRLDSIDLAIFVSRNAVEFGIASVRERRPWPPGPRAAAVGAGTRRALEALGLTGVVAPGGPADSAALLAEPGLEPIAGRRVVIFRGEGGREELATALRSRGAQVEYAECYRRVVPATDVAPLVREWGRGAVDAVAVSSGEGLANLARLLGAADVGLLAGTPLFVPHARVAEQARALGATSVVVCGAQDEEVLAALVAYFRSAG